MQVTQRVHTGRPLHRPDAHTLRAIAVGAALQCDLRPQKCSFRMNLSGIQKPENEESIVAAHLATIEVAAGRFQTLAPAVPRSRRIGSLAIQSTLISLAIRPRLVAQRPVGLRARRRKAEDVLSFEPY